MTRMIAFDLDGTLAESKQPLSREMANALADLLEVADVAVISGGDWPQFEQQIAARLPARTRLDGLWLMPTTGTKLYVYREERWSVRYAELFTPNERHRIIAAFEAALAATGLCPEQTWGPRIEDRGSQITFSALGQQAPIAEKETWDPDFSRRRIIQSDLLRRLPGFSINMGGTTSIDITHAGIDKGYGLTRLSQESGVPFARTTFVGDAIFPGGNDYPAKLLGIDTISVTGPSHTLHVIAAMIAASSAHDMAGIRPMVSYNPAVIGRDGMERGAA